MFFVYKYFSYTSVDVRTCLSVAVNGIHGNVENISDDDSVSEINLKQIER